MLKFIQMSNHADVRPSPIAGRWYPGNSARLADSIDEYILAAKAADIQGEVVAVVAPHAGHMYSGQVAGYAFAACRGLQPSIIAVISPMHQPYFQPLLTTAHEAYETPLGQIPVATNAIQEINQYLVKDLGYPLAAVKFDEEHSLEIELPFLQRVIPTSFELLPIMVREVSPIVVTKLGLALAKTLQGKNSLLVASTDLSHFYTQAQAQIFDHEILHRLEQFDPDAFLCAEEEGKGFACGRGAVAAVMWAARELGANKVQILHYATSGDITGDYTQVVGYGAAVMIKSNTSRSQD